MALDKEHRDWLTLALVPGVGTANFIRLLARFHTPANVLEASEAALKEVVGQKVAERIRKYKDVVDIDTQKRLIEQYDVKLITLDDPEYPQRLAEIYNPPLVLFVRGELIESDTNAVAIVGTRRPTPYGIRMAEKFGRELAARGVTVVSGMAIGTDTAAHRGALDAGGRTIAIFGNGVDVVYPRQNAELMDQIIKQGCAISEFDMGARPSRGNFPYRNRVISGMTLGTLIIEAPATSGALITARQAAEQGREVFAVPGQVGVRNSEGPHSLIRDGAKLAETVEDILVELEVPAEIRTELPADIPRKSVAEKPSPPDTTPVRSAGRETQSRPAPTPEPEPERKPAKTTARNITDLEKQVLSVLSPDGSFVDEIAQACRVSVSDTLSSLTILELKGLVRQFSGKRFAPR